MDDEKLMSTVEVAALFGVTRSAVYRWVFERRLPFFKTSGPRSRTLFAPQDVRAFIAARRVPSYDEQAADRRRSAGKGKGLDFESATALVAGALQSPEGLEVVEALVQAHRQLGPERFGELTERVVVDLPPEQRGEAKRRLAAAEEALAKVLLLMAPAEAVHG